MSQAVPTDRELDALKVIWHQGHATVREIWKVLCQTEPELAYTTVLSLMQSMAQKGLVGFESRGRAYAYFAKIERASTFQKLAKNFLDKVFDGAMDQYLVRALESNTPSSDELDRLEAMIAQARQRQVERDQTEEQA